jgi:hypothetical protein
MLYRYHMFNTSLGWSTFVLGNRTIWVQDYGSNYIKRHRPRCNSENALTIRSPSKEEPRHQLAYSAVGLNASLIRRSVGIPTNSLQR